MADITQNFSQLLLTYGPGAMLDLPDHAVVVSGIQDWRYGDWKPIEEDRLIALLRQQLGPKLNSSFQGLRPPPVFDEDRRDDNAPGVEVRLFPEWFTADETSAPQGEEGDEGRSKQGAEKRRRMVEFSDLDVKTSAKLSYTGGGKKVDVNPIRFVGACTKGHLQDINWRRLAHRNGDQSCRKPLYWVEKGVSSDPSDISVRCTCGAYLTLVDLYIPKFLGGCECHSPWLNPRRVAEEVCKDDLRLLPRSATNTYFPQTVTVISLTKSEDRVRQVIAEQKTTIDSIRVLPNFLEILRSLPQTREAFKDFSDDEIIRGLSESSGEEGDKITNLRVAEFDLLASGAPLIGNDHTGSFFYGETLPPASLQLEKPWADFLKGVVKVHRLREVTCLYGFTRLEPPPTTAESELEEMQLSVDGASLSRDVNWLPAIEQFGEGIFLHINPDFVKEWASKPEVIVKAAELKSQELADAEHFGRKPVHFGIIYWAIHSLSHAFMAELALECGYPLSSLKERIYSSGGAQADRFGILIYTSTAGGQGTLGGLSSMAARAGELLARATQHLTLCSNDPICAEQSAGNHDYPLQGAACHACLLVPETSCEARNSRLDRALLRTTVLGGGNPLFCEEL